MLEELLCDGASEEKRMVLNGTNDNEMDCSRILSQYGILCWETAELMKKRFRVINGLQEKGAGE